jgi:hypothetical protein
MSSKFVYGCVLQEDSDEDGFHVDKNIVLIETELGASDKTPLDQYNLECWNVEIILFLFKNDSKIDQHRFSSVVQFRLQRSLCQHQYRAERLKSLLFERGQHHIEKLFDATLNSKCGENFIRSQTLDLTIQNSKPFPDSKNVKPEKAATTQEALPPVPGSLQQFYGWLLRSLFSVPKAPHHSHVGTSWLDHSLHSKCVTSRKDLVRWHYRTNK